MWKPPEATEAFTPPEAQAGAFVPPEAVSFTPPEAKPSIWQAARSDVQDLKTGLSSLAAGAMKPGYKLLTEGPEAMRSTIADQAETVTTALPHMGKDIYDTWRGYFKHPAESFREHPVNMSLDALALADILGGAARLGIRGVGEGARLMGAETVASGARRVLEGAPEVLKAGQTTMPQTLSKNPIIQLAQKALIKTSENVPGVSDVLSTPGIRGLVPPGAISEEARQALLAGKTMERTTLASSAEYGKNLESIKSKIGSLGQDEQNAFTAVVEGRAVPFKMTPQFHEALDFYKNKVLTEAQRFSLPEETAKRTAYQPLVMATKAKYDEPMAVTVLKNDPVGLVLEANKGNQSAIQKIYLDAARGDKTARGLVSKWNSEVQVQRLRDATSAARSFLGTGAEAKAAARSIARELTPEPIYFPHVFQDKLRISDFIRLPNRLQKFRPAFLKARTGAEGYVETDPAYALAVHEKQVQKFRSTEALVNGVLEKFAEPLPTASALKPGNVVFAPEGAFKFYRTYLSFQDKFLQGLGLSNDMDDSFIKAAESIMGAELPQDRAMVGVRRAPMYQIPKEVAAKLQDELKVYNWPQTINPAMKLLYDKPLDAFRYTVLGFRPGWVLHNVAGNIVTSLLSRVNLAAGLKKTLNPEMMKAIEPIAGELEASSLRSTERRLMGASRLQRGNALERGAQAVGRVLFSNEPVMESDAIEAARKIATFPVRTAKGFAESIFEANSQVEDAFRKMVAVEKAHGMALDAATKDTVKSFFPARQAWDRLLGKGAFTEDKIVGRMKEMAENPELRQEVLDHTFRVLNNYAALNAFERSVVRRVVPFWSWWKFVNTFAVRTAFQDPIMADLARYASQFGNDIRKEEWKKNGLDVREMPLWTRYGTIVGEGKNGKRLLMARAPNPFTALGPEGINFSPYIDLAMMLSTGKDPGTGRYIDPNITEVNGRLYYTAPGGKNPVAIEHATVPNPASQFVRKMVPPVAEAEQMAVPYKFDPSSPVVGKHSYVPDARGRKQDVEVRDRISAIFGLPVKEIDRIVMAKTRLAQVQAVRQILRKRAMSKRANRE